ncbi:MAG: DUF167 domain-containing protein [Chloroflexota bacterium]|nr:DUF167 domain-containing protein [Chloroflexota bacterium]MYE32981.1 DUF167 domain-containing protein [Chloroflexota bacterium]
MPTARITVQVTPRASSEEILGFEEDALRVRVTAPPARDRANRALERLLARRLDLRPSAVQVVSGQTVRRKVVEIDGLEEAEVRSRLGGDSG